MARLPPSNLVKPVDNPFALPVQPGAPIPLTQGSASPIYYLGGLAADPALPDDGVARMWFRVDLGQVFMAVGTVKQVIYPFEAPNLARSSGTLTLSTSLQDVVGATLSLDAGTYIIIGVFDMNISTTGCGLLEGYLDVGGTAQTGRARFGDPAVAHEATVTQAWLVTIASSPTTVKLQAKKGSAGGTAGVVTVNTLIAAFIPAGAAVSGSSHAEVHDLMGADHTVAGLTEGHFLRATGAASDAFEAHYRMLEVTIDGGGSVITTGVKGYIGPFKFNGVVEDWTIVADQSGSIVVDVWKDVYANFPPTVADTIAGAEKPTLAAAQKNQDLSLSSFATAVADGDIWAINVDSVATVTWVKISFRIRET